MSAHQYQYGWTSILLHWTVAGLVIWLFWSGQQIEHAEAPSEKLAQVLVHNSVGVLLIIAALLRTALRLVKGMAARPKQSAVLDLLAEAVPWILLVSVLVIICTGGLASWLEGKPIGFFGVLDIPSPVGQSMNLRPQVVAVHSTVGHLIILLVLLHVLGGLKHLLIDRDGVFGRMIFPARTS